MLQKLHANMLQPVFSPFSKIFSSERYKNLKDMKILIIIHLSVGHSKSLLIFFDEKFKKKFVYYYYFLLQLFLKNNLLHYLIAELNRTKIIVQI